MRPKIEWLEAYVAFAEALNFTRAAAEIGLSQPALHVQVRKLSEVVGGPLYLRDGRQLSLTPLGRRTLAFARESLERCDAFLSPQTEPPTVLAAGEGALLYLIDDAVEAFVAANPSGLRLRVLDGGSTRRAVRTGEADIGVCPASSDDEFESSPIADIGLAVVLPAGHRLSGDPPLPVEALVDEPLILPPPGPIRTKLGMAEPNASGSCSTRRC